MINKELFDLYQKIVNNPSYDKVFSSYYHEAKNEIKDLLDTTFTLDAYENSEGFSLLKEFLIDRYAKLYAFAKYVSLHSTSFSDLPEELIDKIFITFGFTFHKNLKLDEKRIIVQNIVDLINKKGTKILVKVIQTILRLTDVDIIDLDLVLDTNGEWILVDPKTGVRFKGVSAESDNHWLTKTEDLQKRTNQRQFRTPFFTLTTHRYKLDDLTTGVLFIELLVRDELRSYAKTNSFSTQIYIDLFETNLSLTEIWLLITSLFGLYADVYNAKLNEQPCGVVVFDHDEIDKDEIRIEAFNRTTNIDNLELKQLTYQFYMSNFDRLESVTFEEFDSFLASQWSDYYALDEAVRKAYVTSAYFFMKLSKIEIPHITIDTLWEYCNQIVSYRAKYDKFGREDVGLLYIFYDLFVRYYSDDSSEIVKKLIKTPLTQLNIVNPKLYRFVKQIQNKINEKQLKQSDIRKLIIYLFYILATYIYETYLVYVPFEVVFGTLSSLYSSKVLEVVYDDLKPIYARPLASNSSMHFILNHALLYSFVYDDQSIFTKLKQILLDILTENDEIEKVSISLRFDDLINGLTHTYFYMDPNRFSFLLNRYHKLHVNCCNTRDVICISNFKAIKDWWKCCNNESSSFAVYNIHSFNTKPFAKYNSYPLNDICQWCSDKENLLYFYNSAVYNQARYSVDLIPEIQKVHFEKIDPTCLKRKIHDGILIPTYYYKLKSKTLKVDIHKKKILNLTGNAATYNSSRFNLSYYDIQNKYPVLTLDYFNKFKYVTNEEIEKWLIEAIKQRDTYQSKEIVKDLLNHPILAFMAVNYDYNRIKISQNKIDHIDTLDALPNVNILTKLMDKQQLQDKKRMKLQSLIADIQKISDYLKVTISMFLKRCAFVYNERFLNKLYDSFVDILNFNGILKTNLQNRLQDHYTFGDSHVSKTYQKTDSFLDYQDKITFTLLKGFIETLLTNDNSYMHIIQTLKDIFYFNDSYVITTSVNQMTNLDFTDKLLWQIYQFGSYNKAVYNDKHLLFGPYTQRT